MATTPTPHPNGFVMAFKSIGHFFAKVAEGVIAALPKIEAGIQVVENAAPRIEELSSLIPVYGPLAVSLEKLSVAALGELSGVLHKGDDALKQHLLDAGMDSAVLASIEDFLSHIPGWVQLAKDSQSKQAAA